MLSTDEAHELSPLAGLDGVLAAAFCPLAGYATPDAAVQGYAGAARANGARIPDARGGDGDGTGWRCCGRTPDRDGLCGVRSGHRIERAWVSLRAWSWP